MDLLLSTLTVLLQQMPPHQMPHHDPGVWWTHWAWMLLWIVLAIVVVLLVVRLLWPPRR
jgi:hypothetical protein